MDSGSMLRGYIILLFFLRSCSGVIYTLNDTEYAKMPPLYGLDTYQRCLLDPEGLYCITDFDLFTEEKSELMEMIHEYSAVTYTHYNHTQIHRGICVTRTCKDILHEYTLNGVADVKSILEACLNKTIWDEYRLQARLSKIHYCHKEIENTSYDSSDMFVIVCYFMIVVLNIIGSLYDMLFCKYGKGNPYLMAFSMRRNWYKLTASANDGPDPRIRRFKLFHGIKAFTMACVIFSHITLILGYSYLENPKYIEEAGHDLSKQLMLNGSLVTHTFFVMTGFLVAYNFQINAENHNVSWWHVPKAVFLRWFRLTPVLALMLATMATLMRHAGTGPLWELLVTTESQACRKYWWTNLLYFNNYILSNQCFLQAWYVACDLQLFILGIVICMIARTPRAQKIAVTITLAVGTMIVGAHTYFQNLDAIAILTPEKYRNFFTTDDTMQYMYRRGHTNIPTYTMGLAAGFLTYNLQTRGVDVTKYMRYRWMTWLTVPLGVTVLVSGGVFYTDKVHSAVVKTLYAMSFRQIFQCIVIMFMLATIFKIDNVQRRVIEWRGFTWLSRVSYNAFLVHSLVQRGMYGVEMYPVHITAAHLVTSLTATLAITFSLGAILYLTVESPVSALAKVIFQPARPTKDAKEAQELPSSKNSQLANHNV